MMSVTAGTGGSPRNTRTVIGMVLFLAFLVAIPALGWSPSIALVCGLLVGIIFGNPFPQYTKPVTKYLLQASIVGLGFGININKVVAAGQEGFVFTLLSLSAAIGLGYLLGRLFRVDRVISYLVSVGTAICGGSAIAAVSQVVEADDQEVSISIGTVFILNAIALLIFPPLGHWAELTQHQFGIWAAIAIHDTSSVVGAAASYGNEALTVATTVKLARALWIVPLALLSAAIFKKKSSWGGFPWFILFFLVASMLGSWVNMPLILLAAIVHSAKAGFSITLFLIGAGISLGALKRVGPRPLLLGVVLWVIILVSSLYLISKY